MLNDVCLSVFFSWMSGGTTSPIHWQQKCEWMKNSSIAGIMNVFCYVPVSDGNFHLLSGLSHSSFHFNPKSIWPQLWRNWIAGPNVAQISLCITFQTIIDYIISYILSCGVEFTHLFILFLNDACYQLLLKCHSFFIQILHIFLLMIEHALFMN